MQYHFLHRIQWWVTGALSHYQCEQPRSQGLSSSRPLAREAGRRETLGTRLQCETNTIRHY